MWFCFNILVIGDDSPMKKIRRILSFHHNKLKYSQETPKPTPLENIIMQEPQQPENCCGNQCVHCVWNVYFEEKEKYDK